MSELLALFERETEVDSLELLDLLISEFELVLEFERCTEFELCMLEFLEDECFVILSGLAVPDELHPPFDDVVFVVAE